MSPRVLTSLIAGEAVVGHDVRPDINPSDLTKMNSINDRLSKPNSAMAASA